MASTVRNRSTKWSFLRGGGIVLALAAALTAAGTGTAVADYDSSRDARVIKDKWVMSIGGYLVDFDTTAAVGSGTVIGTVVRLEDQLNLDSNKTFVRGDGFVRFNPRHAIGFGFWSLNRSGQNMLNQDITWDGIDYPLNAVLDSSFDVSWLRVDWRYSFLRSERGEAGFNAGFSTYDFSASLEGMGSINGGTPATFKGEESITLPVPTFGIFVNFAITPNVLFKSWFTWLDLSVGDFDGQVSDVSILFEYYFSEHVGIGGGSARTNIEYKSTGNDPVSIDYKQSGFLGYFTFVWGDAD